MNWKDELKKKHFREEYECTHPDARPIYLFNQKMDELIADISSLLKKERIDECERILTDRSIFNMPTKIQNLLLERISELEGGSG